MKTNYFILILIFAACSGKTKEAESSNQTEFLEFVSTLPKVKIPFEVYCAKCCDHPEYDPENETIRKYLPQGSALMGVISQTDKYVSILVTFPFDMIIPTVVVYDLTGNKISQQAFMTGWCDRDLDYLQLQYLKINADFSFSEIDTAYSFEMDSLNKQILDTTDIKIDRRNFFISEDGKINQQ